MSRNVMETSEQGEAAGQCSGSLALTILTNVSSWRLCWRWPLSCCAQLPTQWGRRWLVVTDTALTYLNPETGQTTHPPSPPTAVIMESTLTAIMLRYLAGFYGESDVSERFLHHFYFRHDEAVMSF